MRREELLAGARAVGDELEKLALQEDGTATWIGLTQPGEGHWTLAPLGADLYDGIPGVTLFLSYLALVTGEDRYAELARAAFRPLRQDLESIRAELKTVTPTWACWIGSPGNPGADRTGRALPLPLPPRCAG